MATIVRPEWLALITDAELRAECERRSMEYVGGLAVPVGEHRRILAERDQWKCRAEAAEAKRSEAAVRALAQRTAEALGHGWLPDPKTEPIVYGVDRTQPKEGGGGVAYAGSFNETGPGITAKPPQSEPLAFLDEDLLCEDA